MDNLTEQEEREFKALIEKANLREQRRAGDLAKLQDIIRRGELGMPKLFK